MERAVSQQTMDNTYLCCEDFACLENKEDYPRCMVIKKVAKEVLKTLCSLKPACSYCMPYTEIEGFCVCPVRAELYKEYGV